MLSANFIQIFVYSRFSWVQMTETHLKLTDWKVIYLFEYLGVSEIYSALVITGSNGVSNDVVCIQVLYLSVHYKHCFIKILSGCWQ